VEEGEKTGERTTGMHSNLFVTLPVWLWKTQRAHCSLEGILCEAVYWDERRSTRTLHNLGEFAALTVSVEKALAYFATHPDTVLGLFGRYCEESGLELQQAA